MFERLIIATDLSPASYAVVNCLGGLKAFGARHCLLLQCLSLQEMSSISFSYSTAPLERALAEQKKILAEQGFEVETRVVTGSASREINRIANAEGYTLVVVGSHGHSLVGEALLGGLANDIIHNAHKPVLLVRLAVTIKESQECIQAVRCDFGEQVLFPTDFSENAENAFVYLRDLVTAGARRVTLLHVQDKSRIAPFLLDRLEEFNQHDRGRLDNLKTILQSGGTADVDCEVCFGAPFTEIMRVIRERDAHLVVMGSQGRGFVEELFLGSVSHNVARQSPAPVLLIPATRVEK